jgi:hypothetical protein
VGVRKSRVRSPSNLACCSPMASADLMRLMTAAIPSHAAAALFVRVRSEAPSSRLTSSGANAR